MMKAERRKSAGGEQSFGSGRVVIDDSGLVVCISCNEEMLWEASVIYLSRFLLCGRALVETLSFPQPL